ncbi:hypothetical protein [Tenuifilum thalassicum]|uniref:Uncharacterized protein n=1 Tax=Tenuifilum thalassicum TaxID=2590900 RepID=A0A7D4BRJ9_9BACT|nr:hypothetical protein [Tenuifilum thalassicum]QKG79641.1 hypothetical protein FHG85_04980 [Tenuifilum thalassicum]
MNLMSSKAKIVETLIRRGNELFRLPYKKIKFTGNEEADNLLNNINQFPHAFVLACIMDRQIKAERAWLIPYFISQEIGGFDFKRLLKLDLNSLKKFLKEKVCIDLMILWREIFIPQSNLFMQNIMITHQIFGKTIQKVPLLSLDFLNLKGSE